MPNLVCETFEDASHLWAAKHFDKAEKLISQFYGQPKSMPNFENEVLIQPFLTEEWRIYKETRLQALHDSPNAFGSTYGTAIQLADNEWHTRLARVSPEIDLPLKALVNGVVGGMAWAHIHQSGADATYLYQMWVAPEFLGRGVSSAILNAAIRWAKERNSSAMKLGVTVGDSAARRLYDKAGFTAIGAPEPLREGSTLMVQNMPLQIS